jgi:hypothetical protein
MLPSEESKYIIKKSILNTTFSLLLIFSSQDDTAKVVGVSVIALELKSSIFDVHSLP